MPNLWAAFNLRHISLIQRHAYDSFDALLGQGLSPANLIRRPLNSALSPIAIGHFDHGNVLYDLLRRRGNFWHWLPFAAVIAVVVGGYRGSRLMVVVRLLFGTGHPLTSDENVSLRIWRNLMGGDDLRIAPPGVAPIPLTIRSDLFSGFRVAYGAHASECHFRENSAEAT